MFTILQVQNLTNIVFSEKIIIKVNFHMITLRKVFTYDPKDFFKKKEIILWGSNHFMEKKKKSI